MIPFCSVALCNALALFLQVSLGKFALTLLNRLNRSLCNIVLPEIEGVGIAQSALFVQVPFTCCSNTTVSVRDDKGCLGETPHSSDTAAEAREMSVVFQDIVLPVK
jgi:hypothetical protein